MRVGQKRKKISLQILIIGIVVLVVLILIFLKLKFLNINSVEVIGDNLDCASKAQVKEETHSIGKNLLSLETKNSVNQIKNKFICIKTITFSKVFPDKLKIAIAARKPAIKVVKLNDIEASFSSLLEDIATPSAQQSEEGYLMDDEGVIFSKVVDNLDLPDIFINNQNIALGRKLTNINVEDIFKILNKIKSFGIDIKTVVVSNNDFIIYSLPKIIFSLKNEIDPQIASLQLILEKSKIDGSMVDFIDLRFDKPIIKIAPKKNG